MQSSWVEKSFLDARARAQVSGVVGTAVVVVVDSSGQRPVTKEEKKENTEKKKWHDETGELQRSDTEHFFSRKNLKNLKDRWGPRNIRVFRIIASSAV